MEAISFLEYHGYILHEIAPQDKHYKMFQSSCFWITQKLLDTGIFEYLHLKTTPQTVRITHTNKKGEKVDLPVQETEYFKRVEQLIAQRIEIMSLIKIDFDGDHTHKLTETLRSIVLEGGIARQFSTVIHHIVAIHDRSFERGGRMFHQLQRLPRNVRKTVTFQGQSTCEIDYSTQHPTYMDLLMGREIDMTYTTESNPKDIYTELGSLIGFQNSEARKIIKAVVNARLQCENDQKAIASAWHNENIQHTQSEIIMEALHERWPMLRHMKEAPGMLLQWLDSRTMLMVIEQMNALNIAGFDVFDSVRIRTMDQDRVPVTEIMLESAITTFRYISDHRSQILDKLGVDRGVAERLINNIETITTKPDLYTTNYIKEDSNHSSIELPVHWAFQAGVTKSGHSAHDEYLKAEKKLSQQREQAKRRNKQKRARDGSNPHETSIKAAVALLGIDARTFRRLVSKEDRLITAHHIHSVRDNPSALFDIGLKIGISRHKLIATLGEPERKTSHVELWTDRYGTHCTVIEQC